MLADPAELRRILDVDGQVAPDSVLLAACSTADQVLAGKLVPGDHTQHPTCREAALQIASQVWVARYAPGGQVVGGDINPIVSPYLLGAGLALRVRGLVEHCWKVEGLVG